MYTHLPVIVYSYQLVTGMTYLYLIFCIAWPQWPALKKLIDVFVFPVLTFLPIFTSPSNSVDLVLYGSSLTTQHTSLFLYAGPHYLVPRWSYHAIQSWQETSILLPPFTTGLPSSVFFSTSQFIFDLQFLQTLGILLSYSISVDMWLHWTLPILYPRPGSTL